ncbi:MAG: hypothetical protein ABIQ05_09450 [Candidatus Limnocylindria bacterium]
MRRFIAVVAAAAALIALAVPAAASDNMNNWHIHDGKAEPGHAPIGFFPTVLGGLTNEQYLLDPAVCPNATDKVLLGPDGLDGNQVVRSGICMTSKYVIQLRTQDSSRPAPTLASGWKLGSTAGGLSTYVRLTALP